MLGVRRCVFWGMPDGFLIEDDELRGMVVRTIRTLKPDIVITWDGFRAAFNHTDHRAIGRAVRDALYPAAHDPHYYSELAEEGIGPHRTAELLLAGAADPDYHVDIGPYLELKAEAIAATPARSTTARRTRSSRTGSAANPIRPSARSPASTTPSPSSASSSAAPPALPAPQLRNAPADRS